MGEVDEFVKTQPRGWSPDLSEEEQDDLILDDAVPWEMHYRPVLTWCQKPDGTWQRGRRWLIVIGDGPLDYPFQESSRALRPEGVVQRLVRR